MLRYSVSPLLGNRTLWVTEITHVRSREYFVDEQRLGPYRLWHPEHHFHPRGDGGVEVENIFRHRAKNLEASFGQA